MPSPAIGVPGWTRRACAFIRWTRRFCCSLGRATLICCSSFYEEVPSTRQVEVPEAVGVVLPLQCEGGQHHRHEGLLVIRRARAGLPRSGQEDVHQPLAARQGVAVLKSGRGYGRDRAQTRSQQHRSTADPRGQGRGAAMPQGITGLGSRGHQAVSHGPLAAWRSHGEGHDCGPPVCGAFQLGAGCRCNTLGLLHSVRPHSCGTVTAAARTVPRCISKHVVTAARGVAHAEVEASQSASRRTKRHVSVVAACLPVAGCRPSSPQCGMADGVPSPCKRVDVPWETRSTRCAVTSGNETLSPLIHVACAGSSNSSHSMPLGGGGEVLSCRRGW
ncbi:hypothetical protein TcCL_ESM11777 [Trypanosoma cruzi]|nr:hypothetical protein TcCL_ESM11777 [Trypanosoma cruzi]